MPENVTTAPVSRVESNKPKAQWVTLDGPAPTKEPPTKQVRAGEVDSQVSLKPPQKQQLDTYPGFWAKVWSDICGLFGYAPAATTQTGQGSSNKPGGDGVGGVGTSPNLEAPYSFDLKKFMQLLKETRDSLHQVQETNNEADEELDKKDKSERAIQWLLQHLKAQRELYEESAGIIRLKYLQHQKEHGEVRKQLGDTKTLEMEAAENERFWGWWKTGTTVVLVAASIALLAASAISSAGISIPAAIAAGTKIIASVSSAANAMTTIMKGAMTKEHQDKQSAVTSLTHLHDKFRELKIPEDIAQLNQNWDQSLKIVTDHLKRLEENRNNTIKSIGSDISGKGG